MGDMADYYMKSEEREDQYQNYKQYKKERIKMNNKIKDVELKVVGVTFNNNDGVSRQQIISDMIINDDEYTDYPVLARESWNRFDKNAVAVFVKNNETGMCDDYSRQIGYIGKEYSKVIAPMMDSGKCFKCKFTEVDKYEDTWYVKINISEV